MSLPIGILASGTGTNAQTIIEKSQSGLLNVNVKLVICDKVKAGVLDVADRFGIPSIFLDPYEFVDRTSYDHKVAEILREYGCQLIVLAGYMRLLSASFLKEFKNAVVNLHPALLPSFPGVHGVADALKYGVKLTGPSVHFVEEKMDAGPLIIQACIPVLQDDNIDTLANRIHKIEHRIYPQALQWIAEGRLELDGRMVRLAKGMKRIQPIEGDWFVWPPLEEGF